MQPESGLDWTTVLDRLEADLDARAQMIANESAAAPDSLLVGADDTLGPPDAAQRARAQLLSTRIEAQIEWLAAQIDAVREELHRVATQQTASVPRTVVGSAPAYLDRRA